MVRCPKSGVGVRYLLVERSPVQRPARCLTLGLSGSDPHPCLLARGPARCSASGCGVGASPAVPVLFCPAVPRVCLRAPAVPAPSGRAAPAQARGTRRGWGWGQPGVRVRQPAGPWRWPWGLPRLSRTWHRQQTQRCLSAEIETHRLGVALSFRSDSSGFSPSLRLRFRFSDVERKAARGTGAGGEMDGGGRGGALPAGACPSPAERGCFPVATATPTDGRTDGPRGSGHPAWPIAPPPETETGGFHNAPEKK